MRTRGRGVVTAAGTGWKSARSTGVTRTSAPLWNRSRITSRSHVEMTIFLSGRQYVTSTVSGAP